MADSETLAVSETAHGEAPALTTTPDIETQIAAHIQTLRTATNEEVQAAISATAETAVARIFLEVFESSRTVKRGDVRDIYELAQAKRGLKTPFAVAFNNTKNATPFRPFEIKEILYSQADSDRWTLLSENTPKISPEKIPAPLSKVHVSTIEFGEHLADPKLKTILLSLCHQYLGVDIAKIAKALDQKPDEVVTMIAAINTQANNQEFEIQIRNGIAIITEKKVRIVAIDNTESRERFAKQDQQIADILKEIKAKTKAVPETKTRQTFEDIIRDNVNLFSSDLDYQIALELAYNHEHGNTGLSTHEIANSLGEEEIKIRARMPQVKASLNSIGLNVIKRINGSEGVYVLVTTSIAPASAPTPPAAQSQRPPTPPAPRPEKRPVTFLQDTVSQNRPAFMGNNVLFEIARQLARESDKNEPGSTAEELALKHGITYKRMQELLTPLREALESIGLRLAAKPYRGKTEYSIGRRPSLPASIASAPKQPAAQPAATPKPAATPPIAPLAPTARASLDLAQLERKTFKNAEEANNAIMSALRPVILSGQPITTGIITALKGTLDRIIPLQHSGMQNRLQRYIDKLRRAEQNARNGVIRDHHLNEIYTGVQ